MQKFWGMGKSASVDGAKWDIDENNLLAEYHIRYGGYGGYGGIGYYPVAFSDKRKLETCLISCGNNN